MVANGSFSSATSNGARAGLTPDAVHVLFAAQAARTPDAPALIFGRHCLSYGELDARAAVLAGRLSRLRVGPEVFVALSAERSLEQIIAVLAVLKAGGAYVPLDPAYPDDRLSAMLEDARPCALITQRHVVNRLPAFAGPVLYLDDDAFRENGAGSALAEGDTGLRNLAYMIFTSGSTGKPKGVMIEHRSLANHAVAMARHYQLGPDDRVLQFASLSFDVAAEEIFPTWVAGGAVVLWPVTTGVAPVRSFVEFVQEHGITVLNLPAPYWHEWVNELDRVGIPACVRLVITGSDKVSAERYAVWRKYAGSRVRFCAAYGPTEGTITATVFDPEPGFASQGDCLPIGKPIANVETHVLDPSMQPVAEGEAGELLIGGNGLARGYLNQPELTRERFVEIPVGNGEPRRLYRTGDLAKLRSDGNLEFIGRTDDQLKIRGFRVEIGEVENVLRQHRHVREVVAIGRDDPSGNKKLVAYIAIGAQRPEIEELRALAKSQLPEYMVPAAFVLLKALPLTPGGKLDRRQLPSPDIERDGPDKAYIAPRTDTERQLVAIWEEMLDLRPIGIRDNFFEIGGYSLLDARLVAELERKMNVTVPLATIYYARTVETLAQVVERKRSSRRESLLHPYRTSGTRPPLFSHGGSTHLAKYLGEEQPIYWLDHHGTGGFGVPSTIEKMAANYVAEIRGVQPSGPYYLVGYCIGALVMLEVARQLMSAGESIGLLTLIDPTTPRNMRVAKPAGAQAPAQRAAPQRSFLSARIAKVRAYVPRRYRALKRITKRTLCDLWVSIGRRLPVYWRDFYCDEKLSQALARYKPEPYPGSFVLFRQPDNGTLDGWRGFARDRVVFEDTWVDHNEMLEEPYVQVLAGKLKNFLVQSQSADAGSKPAAGANRSSPQSDSLRRDRLPSDSGWILGVLTAVTAMV